MDDIPQNAVAAWLDSPIGRSLLEREQRLVEEALDGIFGEECVQLGRWGEDRAFLRYSRTQRSSCIAGQSFDKGSGDRCVIAQLHRLPLASDSVDSVLLPHTLEYSDRPQAILREVHRVLRADGHIVVLGFKSGGLWGVRRMLPGAAMPPSTVQLISDRRLRDWLDLLDLRLLGLRSYFFRWPLPGNGGAASAAWERRGQQWWPELAACYMLTAQKRTVPLTPVLKPAWRKPPKVVAGLEPTTRTSRIIRIRFDENS